MPTPTYVILGAGQAGGRAAETLRAEGFHGRVVLAGAEPRRPYERPPLSKDLLLGTADEARTYLRPAAFYDEQGIELVLGVQATHVDPAQHIVSLTNGRQLAYDKLLLATGVRPRTLPVHGADRKGIHTLRTLDDAHTLLAAIEGAPRVLIVGAGFIGAEVAAACRKHGLGVTMLEALAVPLQRALGDQIGALYAAIHREHGVDLRLGTGVAAFRGEGRVAEAVLSSGETVACDLVVVGIGTAPNDDFLAGSGLARENGVVVDEQCRTNLPDIHAAGDLARWWHPHLGEYLRVEHYDNAEHQGVAAARAMLGHAEPYAPVPYFWSDQYEHHLQYFGHGLVGGEQVVRGSLAERRFTIFSLRDGLPAAALCLNTPREGMIARRLIAARAPVDPTKLGDPGTDLRSLLPRKS